MAALSPRLELRQSQSLVMTPQLQQAIQILALSNLELGNFLSEAMERNPLLEVENVNGESAQGASERDRGGAGPDLDDSPADGTTDSALANAELPDGAGAQADVARAMNGSGSERSLPTAGAGGGPVEAPDMDWVAAPGIGLVEHLSGQARACQDGKQLLLVLAIIEELDEAGYLPIPVEELAERLGVSQVELEEALKVVQSLEPTGVGARSLAECLALQAKEADRYDPAMAALIANLDCLAKGQLARLMRLCAVDEDDLRDMIAELRAYDPRPGLAFISDEAPNVIPDLFVTEGKDGQWLVEINSETLPRLLVDRSYQREIIADGCDKKVKDWLGGCVAEANWLERALDQRQQTILRVAGEIVRRQEGFFRYGVNHLKPMTLKQIAEKIEVHESTVSRATSNKYLHCARGTFELKYFFSSAIASSGDDGAVSAEAVKAAIRALIDAEDAKSILSDDKLVAILQEKGFDIARRTVAKYREAMGIGSSVQRRRQKALAG